MIFFNPYYGFQFTNIYPHICTQKKHYDIEKQEYSHRNNGRNCGL